MYNPHQSTTSRFRRLSLKAALLFLALTIPGLLQAQEDRYADTAMAGISNEGKHLTDPYVTAGDRAYLIGTQDGNSPTWAVTCRVRWADCGFIPSS